ncbi:class I SAM-dependent methyltransferase [Tepidibacillus marianensis]|uniref:class I SAM-dependent DNA methyltransferase n=1 Tax=Tepidibacillus marianensis TaxID=3131995 RepID=UPI0030CACBA5
MIYNQFATIYDQLMQDAPYDEWVRLTEEIISKFQIDPKQVVDLGCGTGSIAIPLHKKGYQMLGVDLSEEMLAMAYDKMMEQQTHFPLIQQDMCELELPSKVDFIFSYCDSLNYLDSAHDLEITFQKVHDQLQEKGYFVFDLHSPYKITHIFNGQTFAWNEEDVSVIWETEVDVERLIVEHDLTFLLNKMRTVIKNLKSIINNKPIRWIQ